MMDDKDEKVVGKVNKIRRYHFFDVSCVGGWVGGA